MDGVPGRRRRRRSRPAAATVYEFDAAARRACTSTTATSAPLAEHIAKGLYGAFIVDPKDGPRRTPTSS